MIKVYKYALGDAPNITIRLQLPMSARLLAVGAQREDVVVWAELDVDAPCVERLFQMVFTGQHVPDARKSYIGTTTLHDGTVYHVYEV